MVAGCETQEDGGCYCICRLVDAIHTLRQTINGMVVGKGAIYIPDPERRAIFINGMSEEEIKEEENFRLNVAPGLLKQYEEKLKTYELE